MPNLNTIFQSLPESIREWLADENVALFIDEINTKLGNDITDLKSEIIPRLILRFCVQDLEPRDFINELSHQLNISFDSAKTLTKEIEEKILKPIEAPLKIDVGVDLKLLYFANPQMTPSVIAVQPAEKKSQEVLAEIATGRTEVGPRDNKSVIARSETTKQSLQPISKIEAPPILQSSNPKPEEQLKPFVLHEETGGMHSTNQNTTSKPSFSFKVPLDMRPQSPLPTPKANIQLPQLIWPMSPPPKIPTPTTMSGQATTRVVHYSKFFTRLFSSDKKAENKSNIKVPKSRWFI